LKSSLQTIFEFLGRREEALHGKGHNQSKTMSASERKAANENVAQRKARELIAAAQINEDDYWKIVESDKMRQMMQAEGQIFQHQAQASCWRILGGTSTNLDEKVRTEKISPLGLKDFAVICNAGRGGFGCVAKVKMKSTGKIYALKIIKKK